jgi:hypothetical protein
MADVAIDTYVSESAGEGSGSEAYASTLTIEVDSVTTSDVARHLDRKPQSLSPARDALLKKGLISIRRARPDRVHRVGLREVAARPGLIADVDDDRGTRA